MATELNGYLEKLGILTPAQRQLQFQQQMQQYQTQQMVQQRNNIDVGNLSTGFGFPGYMIAQANSGNPGESSMNIPVPQGQDPRENTIAGMLLGGNAQGGTTGINGPGAQAGMGGYDAMGQSMVPQTAAPPSGGMARMSAKLRQVSQYLAKAGDRAGALSMMVEAEKAQKDEDEEDRKASAEGRAVGDQHRQEATAGNPGPPYEVGIGGKDREWRRDIKDNDGKVIGHEKLGSGTTGGDTNIDLNGLGDIYTKEQRGKFGTEFAAQTEAGENLMDTAKNINERINAGAQTGWAGSAVTVIDNAIGGAKSLAKSVGIDDDAQTYVDEQWKTGKWQKLATDTAISRSQFNEITFALAAAQNKGGAVTRADVEKAASQLGASLGDPERAKAVLNDAVDRMASKIQNKYDNIVDPEVQKSVKHLKDAYDKRHKDYMDSVSGAPKVGSKRYGYTFTGGDPANPASWKKD